MKASISKRPMCASLPYLNDSGRKTSAIPRRSTQVGTALLAMASLTACVPSGLVDDTGGTEHASPPAMTVDWEAEMTGRGTPDVIPLNEDLLVVGTSTDSKRQLTVLDTTDGTERWTREVPQYGDIWVEQDTISFITEQNAVVTLDVSVGAERFRHDIDDNWMIASIAVTEGWLMVADSGKHDEPSRVSGIDLTTGEVAWKNNFDADIQVAAPTLHPHAGSVVPNRFLKHATSSSMGFIGGRDEFSTIAVDVSTGATHEVTERLSNVDIRSAMYQLEPATVTVVSDPDDDCRVAVHHLMPDKVTIMEGYAWFDRMCDERLTTGYQAQWFGQDANGHPQLWNLESGSVVWTAETPGVPLYVGSNTATYRDSRHTLITVDSTTGEQLWAAENALEGNGALLPSGTNAFVGPCPALSTDSCIWASETGELQWSLPGRLLAGFPEDTGFYYSSGETDGFTLAKAPTHLPT